MTKSDQPLPFQIGKSYAFCLVAFAMGLMYGPLYPPAYLVVALGLSLKYYATRFGLRHWFGLPPTVDQDMMMSLRWQLGKARARRRTRLGFARALYALR